MQQKLCRPEGIDKNIQSDEKQGSTTKITLPNKAITENESTDERASRTKKKLREFTTTIPVLYKMSKGSSLRRKRRSKPGNMN